MNKVLRLKFFTIAKYVPILQRYCCRNAYTALDMCFLQTYSSLPVNNHSQSNFNTTTVIPYFSHLFPPNEPSGKISSIHLILHKFPSSKNVRQKYSSTQTIVTKTTVNAKSFVGDKFSWASFPTKIFTHEELATVITVGCSYQ